MAGVVLSTWPAYPIEGMTKREGKTKTFKLGEFMGRMYKFHYLDNKVGVD